MPLFFNYHHDSEQHRTGDGKLPPTDPKDWPEEWKTVEYKTYPGVPRTELPEFSLDSDYLALIRARHSARGGHRRGLSLPEISAVLGGSCGMREVVRTEGSEPMRVQPSGGARYPIEVYYAVLKMHALLLPGIYHYNVRAHALERIKVFPEGTNIGEYFTYPWAKECTSAIFMTAILARSVPKYGERAYRYALLEAGHIGQGIYLAAEAQSINCVAMGGTHDSAIARALDIDGLSEALLYTLMLAK